MKEIELHIGVEEINRNQWNHLIESSNVSNFFQTPECYDFYVSLSFLKPFVFGVSENEILKGVICGYIIADGGRVKQYFSRRAIIPGGILLTRDISEEVIRKLLQTSIDELKKKIIYIEIRNYNDYLKYRPIFESSGFIYQKHLNYKINLKSEDIVFKNLSDSKRRQIKQARKAGVYWEETKREEDIKDFYSILSRLYKTKIKRPLFPVEFFQKLAILSQGRLIVVKKDNQIIGGMACVKLKNKVLYEWFVCGDETIDKKYYPSVMATWSGIEYALKNAIQYFDFMGAGKPDEDYGVRNFKIKFGGKLTENGRFLFVSNKFLYRLGSLYISSKIIL